MREEVFRIFGFIVMGLVILLGIFAAVHIISVSPLWQDPGAAWVQAIGSIAAIVGTWYFTKLQFQHAERLRLAEKLEADAVLAHIAYDLSYAAHRTLNNIREKLETQLRKGSFSEIGTQRLDDLAMSLRNFAQKDIRPNIYSELLILQREIAYTVTAMCQHNREKYVEPERVYKATRRLRETFECRNRIEAILMKARSSAGMDEEIILTRDVTPDDNG